MVVEDAYEIFTLCRIHIMQNILPKQCQQNLYIAFTRTQTPSDFRNENANQSAMW